MKNTKERILETALVLFARDGYEAVSTSMIAGELSMTKGALYKHYKNKQDIFDSIVNRMKNTNGDKSDSKDTTDKETSAPTKSYAGIDKRTIVELNKIMFNYWTEDSFASAFRKMIMIEQYRNAEMAKLVSDYLTDGPVGYMTDMYSQSFGISMDEAAMKAAEVLSLMFFYFNIYDASDDKESVKLKAFKAIEYSLKDL